MKVWGAGDQGLGLKVTPWHPARQLCDLGTPGLSEPVSCLCNRVEVDIPLPLSRVGMGSGGGRGEGTSASKHHRDHASRHRHWPLDAAAVLPARPACFLLCKQSRPGLPCGQQPGRLRQTDNEKARSAKAAAPHS